MEIPLLNISGSIMQIHYSNDYKRTFTTSVHPDTPVHCIWNIEFFPRWAEKISLLYFGLVLGNYIDSGRNGSAWANYLHNRLPPRRLCPAAESPSPNPMGNCASSKTLRAYA